MAILPIVQLGDPILRIPTIPVRRFDRTLGHLLDDMTETMRDAPGVGLAANQVPYLKAVGVLPADFKADQTAFLLNDALGASIPFIYWSSGVMAHWEADIYAKNLPATEWNQRWWHYVEERRLRSG